MLSLHNIVSTLRLCATVIESIAAIVIVLSDAQNY